MDPTEELTAWLDEFTRKLTAHPDALKPMIWAIVLDEGPVAIIDGATNRATLHDAMPPELVVHCTIHTAIEHLRVLLTSPADAPKLFFGGQIKISNMMLGVDLTMAIGRLMLAT